MYIKVKRLGDQWFRDDGTLVGETANTYYNKYYNNKSPIIKLLNGSFIKPVYGRINPKTNRFEPLCEGVNAKLCTGTFCKGLSENPYICPRRSTSSTDGYYVLLV